MVNPLRRAAEIESALLRANPPVSRCLEEVLLCSQGQVGEQPHQFNFDQTLVRQLRTSGFSNNSFFTRAWQEYETQYQRDHQGRAPNLETIRAQFLNPFVDAVSNLLFPADQRNGEPYANFRRLLGRWALCQTTFNNLVLHQFTDAQRQLLVRHDWLHLSANQRNQLLRNVPAVRDLVLNNEQMRERMLQLPTFSRQDAIQLQRLIPRPADAGGGAAQAPMSPEEQHLRRGVERYIADHPAQRAHLQALLRRAPADRSAGDTIQLTVCSIMPFIQGANDDTYRNMLTCALYQYLQRQPNGMRGPIGAALRTQLQVHSDEAATRDAVVSLVDAARRLQTSPNRNALLQQFTTAAQIRDMPGLQR